MKRKWPLFAVTCAFAILLITKVLLNGLYLKTSSPSSGFIGAAQAEETVVPERSTARLSEALAKKEKDLEEREERLKKREARLLPMKEEVEAKMAELNELQDKLTSLARDLAEKEQARKDEKMGHLVSLYSAMEPARAAAIMDKLKIDTVVLILRYMRGKSAGQILAMMEPAKGAVISEELSRTE